MNKFLEFMDKYIVPVATKIGGQRHLVAIRDGFLAMLGLTMVASIATLLQALPIKSYQNFVQNTEFGNQLLALCGDINWGAFTFMALFACIAIGHSLWKSYGKEGSEGALVAAASLLILTPQTVPFTPEGAAEPFLVRALDPSFLGATGLFTAMLVALISVEIFRMLSNSTKLQVKMPDMVPPAVSKSFLVMFPAMITLTLAGLFGILLRTFGDGNYLNTFISTLVQAPLQEVTDSLGAAILIPFLTGLFWSVGLHGGQLTGAITTPLLTGLSAENMALAASGATEGYYTLAGPFFTSYVWLGGAGATIGLLISFLMIKKARERFKVITGLGIGPGCFNINEPVIFGVPIVLNPIFMIPFIIIPIILSVVAYFAVSSGLVLPSIVQSVPWTTPPVISGFLANGHWTGALLSGFNFLLSIVLYFPFVKIAISIEEKQALKAMNEANNK